MTMWTLTYWKDLGERVVASFAGGVLGSWLIVDGLNLLEVDWGVSLGFGLGAAVVSLLKGLAAKALGNPESASLVK
jgi:hypothetical protein